MLAELGHILDARIALAALNVADIRRIKTGFLGQFFLSQFTDLPALADVASESGEDGVTFRHGS